MALARAVSLAASLLLLIAAAPIAAAPTFTVDYGPDEGSLSTWTPQNLGEIDNGDGTFSFVGSSSFGGGNFLADWNVTTDADPFVDGVFAITNNSGVTQNFVLSFGAPVMPALDPAFGAAIVSGSFITNTDGGTLGHVGMDPMFTATVDGTDFMSLLPFDSSIVLVGFNGAVLGPESFGLPGFTEPIPGGVSTSIGLRLSFTLTPGDSASYTSRFEVVPEPGTALLLVLGLAGLAAARRR